MMPEELNEQNFATKTSEGVSLVDFWAPWCGPCRMQSPIIDKLADEVSDVQFYKVNIDENPGIAQQFGIMSIPTMFIMKDGQVMETIVGLHQHDDLMNLIDQYR